MRGVDGEVREVATVNALIKCCICNELSLRILKNATKVKPTVRSKILA